MRKIISFIKLFHRTKTVSNALKGFQPIYNNKRINESSSAAAERYKELTNPEYAEKKFINKMVNIKHSRIYHNK
jgi:hypothetical protein